MQKWREEGNASLEDLPREKLIELVRDMISCVNELNGILALVATELRGPLN